LGKKTNIFNDFSLKINLFQIISYICMVKRLIFKKMENNRKELENSVIGGSWFCEVGMVTPQRNSMVIAPPA